MAIPRITDPQRLFAFQAKRKTGIEERRKWG